MKTKISRWKRLAPAGALALIALAVAAAQDNAPVKAGASAEPFPNWAFPGPHNMSVPDSKRAYSWVQMFDRSTAVDWFPDDHPTMPPAVKGRLPVYACGFCHLPEGAGRPENAALAGLPYDYMKQQIDDMQSGARISPSPNFGPGVNMMLTITHKDLSKAEAYEAVQYYSGLKYRKYTRIVETTEIPRIARTDSFVYVFDKSGAREPLGERIVEGPDDFERFEMRDHRMTYTAYVPVGSIARGAALAKAGGNPALSCDTCHGADMKGTAIGPPIAGRPLTATFRQMYAFKSGTRNGPGAAFMKPVVAILSNKDMIDLSAYIGSLEP
jgi:cytochrome c553